MILKREFYGNEFIGDPYVLGTTDVGEYFPVYMAWGSTHIMDGIFSYEKPVNKANGYGGQQYNDLFSYLAESRKSCTFTFSYDSVRHHLTVLKGYIADERNNILLCLAVNGPNLFDSDGKMLTDNYRLYISPKFILEEKYKNLYKRIEKDYVNVCHEIGVQVLYMDSRKIEAELFSNSHKVTFTTIAELQSYLTSDLGENLFFDIPIERTDIPTGFEQFDMEEVLDEERRREEDRVEEEGRQYWYQQQAEAYRRMQRDVNLGTLELRDEEEDEESITEDEYVNGDTYTVGVDSYQDPTTGDFVYRPESGLTGQISARDVVVHGDRLAVREFDRAVARLAQQQGMEVDERPPIEADLVAPISELPPRLMRQSIAAEGLHNELERRLMFEPRERGPRNIFGPNVTDEPEVVNNEEGLS